MTSQKINTATNKRLAQWWVTCLIEHLPCWQSNLYLATIRQPMDGELTVLRTETRPKANSENITPNTMRTTVTILILLLLISISSRVFACSCIGEKTVNEELKHANVVVVGTVLSKQLIELTDLTILEMFPNDTIMRNSTMFKKTIACYNLLVHDIYKGKIKSDTLKIYTGLGGGDCGIKFEIGRKYIVYGEYETYFQQVNNDFNFPKAKNTIWTYICLRTTAHNHEEIKEIEKFAKKKKRKKDDKRQQK